MNEEVLSYQINNNKNQQKQKAKEQQQQQQQKSKLLASCINPLLCICVKRFNLLSSYETIFHKKKKKKKKKLLIQLNGNEGKFCWLLREFPKLKENLWKFLGTLNEFLDFSKWKTLRMFHKIGGFSFNFALKK